MDHLGEPVPRQLAGPSVLLRLLQLFAGGFQALLNRLELLEKRALVEAALAGLHNETHLAPVVLVELVHPPLGCFDRVSSVILELLLLEQDRANLLLVAA
ncbi:MAG TPA: hypothetical protein VF188_17720, partial [Longimicrobiales bacterium]